MHTANSKKLNLIVLIVIVGFSFAVGLHYVWGHYLLRPFPFNTFLFHPSSLLSDLINDSLVAKNFSPYLNGEGWVKGVYPPLAYVLIYFYKYVGLGTRAYVILAFILSFFYHFVNIVRTGRLDRIEVLKSTFVLAFLTYPFLFCVDRGNIELFAFLLLAASIHSYDSNRFNLSAFLLGITIAIKPTPVLFLLVYLSDKRYRTALLTVTVSLLATLSSFLVLHGSLLVNLKLFLANLTEHTKEFPLRTENFIMFTTDLWDAFHLIGWKYALNWNYVPLLKAYKLFSLILISLVGYQILSRSLPLWRKAFALMLLTLLLPMLNFDYKMINIVIPMYLFLRSQEVTKLAGFYAAIFGLLLIPKDYFNVMSHASIAVILTPLLLLAALTVLCLENRSFRRQRLILPLSESWLGRRLL